MLACPDEREWQLLESGTFGNLEIRESGITNL